MACLVAGSEASGGAALTAHIKEQRTVQRHSSSGKLYQHETKKGPSAHAKQARCRSIMMRPLRGINRIGDGQRGCRRSRLQLFARVEKPPCIYAIAWHFCMVNHSSHLNLESAIANSGAPSV